jgi:hypothetical protein
MPRSVAERRSSRGGALTATGRFAAGHNGLVGIGRAVAVAVVAAIVLAGCEVDPLSPQNVVTATDRHRLAVMRDDPIYKTTVPGSVYDVVGELWAKDSWRRGEMTATIYQRTSPTDTMSPLPAQAFTHLLLTGMQSRGWVIYYAGCSFQSVSASTPPGVFDGPTEWTNTVYAYRIYQGVSYWADIATDVNGPSQQTRTGFASDVSVSMFVPAAGEPANLFPDHPAAIPVGSICAAATGQLKAPVTQGRPIKVAAGSTDPNPPAPSSTLR